MRIGYACMNITLREQGFNKRRLYKKRFEEEGLAIVCEIALHNLDHLERVMHWNAAHDMKIFRFTQIFPWIDQYTFTALPLWPEIRRRLKVIGDLAKELDMRLTIHPSEFCVLASQNQASVQNSIRELNQVSKIFDYMGFDPSPYNKINIHIGGAYGDKAATAGRFCETLYKLGSKGLQSRLTVENDDRANCFSVADLKTMISDQIGVPIVFDYFHHGFNTSDLSEKDALLMACSTWPSGINPVVHYSNSRRDYEQADASRVAHSYHLHKPLSVYNQDVDIIFEAKGTEKAVLSYLQRYGLPK